MGSNLISISRSRAWFQSLKLTLERNELKFLTGKSTLRGFLLHSFSPFYYRRERLWKEGTLFWIYVFKVAAPDGSFTRPLPGWALFSPTQTIQENPHLYTEFNTRLLQWMETPESKNHPKLVETLQSMTSEPLMIPLPETITQGAVVYLSSVTFYPDQFQYPHHGFMLGVAHLNLTKEVMLLPNKYYQQIQ